jgi:hypothetical protein
VEDVPFTPNIDDIDGYRFVRWKAVLRANYFTGARAHIDDIQIPFTYE